MFNILIVILWLIVGALTMVNMTRTDSWNLRFNYVITWLVLMVNLIAKCFEA